MLLLVVLALVGVACCDGTRGSIDLRQKVRKASLIATSQGAIQTSKISSYETILSGGLHFVVSIISRSPALYTTAMHTIEDPTGTPDPFSLPSIVANPRLYVISIRVKHTAAGADEQHSHSHAHPRGTQSAPSSQSTHYSYYEDSAIGDSDDTTISRHHTDAAIASAQAETELGLAASSSHAGPAEARYHLLLNRFNTFPDHVVLVTEAAELQTSPLTASDFSAWHACVEDLGGVGLFNAGAAAGASQRHKHMQVVPRDVVWEARMKAGQHDAEFQLPVDDLIVPHVDAGRWKPFEATATAAAAGSATGAFWQRGSSSTASIYSIPEFGFVHGLAVLQRKGAAAKHHGSYAVYLEAVYKALLEHVSSQHVTRVGDGKGPAARCRTDSGGRRRTLREDGPTCSVQAYNLMLTSNWMMLVPRSAKEFQVPSSDKTVTVNAFGFLGLLLARGDTSDIFAAAAETRPEVAAAAGGSGSKPAVVRGSAYPPSSAGPMHILDSVTLHA